MVQTPNYDLDIDTSLGGSNASDYVIPSQKAVKNYVDNHAGGSPQWGSITGTLSDQTDLQTALDTKQDLATAVNYGNISNCLTAIPQDIKIELNNGTLTLKAGSKVYVPNGFTGTTPKFDEVVIANDLTRTTNTSGIVFVNSTGTSVYTENLNFVYSGGSTPSARGIWYDTANNLVKYSSDGQTWSGQYSFPVGIVSTSGGQISIIDQVFNGFGYIGGTLFALPGVKGLIPNGRNEDGSLKNIEFTTSGVVTRTATWNSELYTIILNGTTINFVRKIRYFEQTEEPHSPNSQYDVWYNPTENYVRWDNNSISWNKISYCPAGTFVGNSGSITSLTPKTAFHAVDYSEFKSTLGDIETLLQGLR